MSRTRRCATRGPRSCRPFVARTRMRRLLRHRPGAAYRAEINVTPLVDVVLVLLIIFMVITPMLQRGVEVHLPETMHHQQATNPIEPLVISVNRQGEMFLDQENLREADLESRVRIEILRLPAREIPLKGDEEL